MSTETPLTEARLRANRANAQKSTGPTTPEGTAAVSQNALRHGLTARARCITRGPAAEDPAEFDALLAQLREAYRPEGILQDQLVERIADYTWRLRRVQSFELRAIHDSIAEASASTSKAGAVARRDDEIKEIRGDLGESQAFLEYLRKHPEVNPFDVQLTFDVIDVVEHLAAQYGRVLYPYLIEENRADIFEQFVSELGFEDQDQIRNAVMTALERMIQGHQRKLDELESIRRADQAVAGADAPDEHLPIPDRLKLVIRYETTLTRNLDKLVAQLNRLKASGQNPRVADPPVAGQLGGQPDSAQQAS